MISAALAQTTGVKPPTDFAETTNRRVLDSLPFSGRQDSEDTARGFIAGLPDGVIRAPDGRVAFTAREFQVSADAPPPNTMNPSLWRVAQLNSFSGLFKMADRLYQLRSIDLANMTIIEGEAGLIIVDTTTFILSS